MEKVVEVDILEKDDLFERYNKKRISKSLINYIIEETPEFKREDNLKIIINSKLDKNIDCKNLINQGLKKEYERSYKKHFRISITQKFIFLQHNC